MHERCNQAAQRFAALSKRFYELEKRLCDTHDVEDAVSEAEIAYMQQVEKHAAMMHQFQVMMERHRQTLAMVPTRPVSRPSRIHNAALLQQTQLRLQHEYFCCWFLM
jgi:acyl-CoA reductase-like NAD-dependent aldehyde dehydrogenase